LAVQDFDGVAVEDEDAEGGEFLSHLR
jgi:hypothetical protein